MTKQVESNKDKKWYEDKMKSMREEELIDFIRVDVIPNLNSLADRLESYVEQQSGKETGDTDPKGEVLVNEPSDRDSTTEG